MGKNASDGRFGEPPRLPATRHSFFCADRGHRIVCTFSYAKE